jgi:UDP-N-acetylmuramyl tripeptide synthase
VLNADDPLVADLGRHASDAAPRPRAGDLGQHASDPVYFGVEDDRLAYGELQHASDSKHCRRCGAAYVYEAAYLAHLGRYHCPNCGARRPEPSVAAEDVELRGIRSAAFTLRTPAGRARVELPLPGLYNVYNALGAAALCLALGVELERVVAGLEAVEPAFGRAETISLRGRPMSILLVKNPAGANEVLRTLALEDDRLDLFGVLNDRIADGRDVSWVWDADWEIVAPKVQRMTCSGTRAAELALRMKHAGVETERLRVVEDLPAGLDAALAGGEGPLYALPTYTALLELRELLAARGHAKEYWR